MKLIDFHIFFSPGLNRDSIRLGFQNISAEQSFEILPLKKITFHEKSSQAMGDLGTPS